MYDITQYHMRWKPNIMIDSYEMDSEYFNLTLKGGIDNVLDYYYHLILTDHKPINRPG